MKTGGGVFSYTPEKIAELPQGAGAPAGGRPQGAG